MMDELEIRGEIVKIKCEHVKIYFFLIVIMGLLLNLEYSLYKKEQSKNESEKIKDKK
jgi:hypothetical protein